MATLSRSLLPDVALKRILFATDLSENARIAFAYARSLADRYGAGLVILHVLTEIQSLDTAIAYHIGREQWEKIKAERAHEAQNAIIGKKRDADAIKAALEAFCKGARECTGRREPIADETLVVRGDPAEQIIKHAEEKDCDLIVLGSHGHATKLAPLMGSTAKQVLREAFVPVLVVKKTMTA
jgi:nucleotide-binding universal stress UspA family protein